MSTNNANSKDALPKQLIVQVHNSIGVFAAPKVIYVVSDLPKTRSGKIMRRILRKILTGEEDQIGDVSTVCPSFRTHPLLLPFRSNRETQLVDPSIVVRLIKEVNDIKCK